MYVITHKTTGFKHYFNATEAAVFMANNGPDASTKYTVKEFKEFNFENVIYAIIGVLMVLSVFCMFIYYSTS